MAIIRHVVEYTRALVSDGVIIGVKIVGTKSRNGYRYTVDALTKAVALYENAPVYVLHPDSREKRKGSRQLDAHFGSLKRVRAHGDGLFGDLHVKQSHPMAGVILESDGRNFGLSHNAHVEMNGDETEVTRIVAVNSVDLVDNPATTTSLFEEEDMSQEALAELKAGLNKLEDGMAEQDQKFTHLLEAIEKLDPAKLQAINEEAARVMAAQAKPKKTERIHALEAAGPDDGEGDGPPPIGNSHEAFLGVVRGFDTFDPKGA